jgi:hypothetical protein
MSEQTIVNLIPQLAGPVKVSVDFDHLTVRDDGEFWGGAEPYLLFIFFTVDGTSARIEASMDLATLDEEEPTFNVTLLPQFNSPFVVKVEARGGHGNVSEVNIGPIELANDGPKKVPIKDSKGRFEATLEPIPIRLIGDGGDILPSMSINGIPPFVGVFAMLWEEDFTPGDAVEAALETVAEGIQSLVEDNLAQVNLLDPRVLDDLAAGQADIQADAQDAAISQMNLWELIWGGAIDADDLLIQKLAIANVLQLDPKVDVQARYQGSHGDWILVGEIRREDPE